MPRVNLSLSLLMIWAFAASAQQQLTQVPPRPSCTPLFRTGACADLWRAYNQALAQRQREELQLYVNRQRDLASQAATAAAQEQIDALNKLSQDQQDQMRKLQQQTQAIASAAVVETADGHRQGLWEGTAIGAGAVVLVLVLIFVARKLSERFTITRKSEARSAST